jgi:hypothetical protein
MARRYTEQELLGKTKLGLRGVCNEIGFEFDNGMSLDDLIKAILKHQGGAHNTAPAGDNDGSDGADEGDGSVTVTCGASSQVLEVVGKSISYVRREYSSVFNIGRESKAMLNGVEESDESYILEDGDNLEFIKKSGDKA